MPPNQERRRLEELHERSERARAETMTVEEAAHYLGKTRTAVYQAIHRGDLQSIRDGRRLRIPVAVVVAELERLTKQLEGPEEVAG